MVQFVSCWVLVSVLLDIHSGLSPTFSSTRFEVSCFRLRSCILISNKGPRLSSMCFRAQHHWEGRLAVRHEGEVGLGVPTWSSRLHEVLGWALQSWGPAGWGGS